MKNLKYLKNKYVFTIIIVLLGVIFYALIYNKHLSLGPLQTGNPETPMAQQKNEIIGNNNVSQNIQNSPNSGNVTINIDSIKSASKFENTSTSFDLRDAQFNGPVLMGNNTTQSNKIEK